MGGKVPKYRSGSSENDSEQGWFYAQTKTKRSRMKSRRQETEFGRQKTGGRRRMGSKRPGCAVDSARYTGHAWQPKCTGTPTTFR